MSHFLICCLVRNPPFSLTAKLTVPKLHTADMYAVSHSRHVYCGPRQTCLLCHTEDVSAV